MIEKVAIAARTATWREGRVAFMEAAVVSWSRSGASLGVGLSASACLMGVA
jgi:hypothetical protein